ncbi:MAG: BON domain-containing protein [Bacteroidales bacterium]|jgi:osmotically-inducible protein OsmY|nr:BON domain-containing protein [Proteiniphilum sp.]MDD3549698.1 BON domain-containing protein [Bacteroidales bacterium]NCD15531.1 BON domain-containing protein [Bacteroidia bacterium]MDD3980353.1 BON domain-containing protein [Proteiniphilum sp.]MDD5620692.1 BON domain-containing protein [Proteiniphilum sp.]
MKAFRIMTAIALILALGMSVVSCKNVKDADVQNAAQEVVMADPALTGVVVTVQEQIATLTGIVEDEAAKMAAESAVAAVENVKSVVNQIQVIPPAPDYTELDAAINAALADALKDHANVTATVQDGVITLNGEIRERDLPTLMEKMNALNPVQIVNNLTVK